MSGTINNFTGYMLGNSRHQVAPGDKWWPYDTQVYVCLNMDKARQILEQSQFLADSVVWTTIYRVAALSINYDYIKDNMLWTRDASKLLVEAPVFYKDVLHITDKELLNRARLLKPAYARLMNSLNGRKK